MGQTLCHIADIERFVAVYVFCKRHLPIGWGTLPFVLPGQMQMIAEGEGLMPDYRAYKIKNDHVDGVPTTITCDDDQQAIEAAKALADGHDVELWEGARFVIGIKAGETK
jgi:hypothetical protein